MWQYLYGPEHYEIAVQCHNLAYLHERAGDQDAAYSYFVRALRIKKQALGGSHIEVGELLYNFASLCCKKGLTTEGLDLYTQALAIFQANLGPDHEKTQMCAEKRRSAATASEVNRPNQLVEVKAIRVDPLQCLGEN